jgi:hypothetical protein
MKIEWKFLVSVTRRWGKAAESLSTRLNGLVSLPGTLFERALRSKSLFIFHSRGSTLRSSHHRDDLWNY